MSENSPSPRILLISGTDAARIAETATRRVNERTGGSDDAFGLDVVRQGDNRDVAATIHELISTLRAPSFLPSGKVVWLRDFDGFANEGAKTAKGADASAFRELCDALEKRLPPTTSVVLSGPGIDRRKRLYNVCEANGGVELIHKPDVTDRNWQTQMAAAIRAAAEERHMSLPEPVVAFLVNALGSRTERIGSELDKLIAYCGGPDQPITEEAAWEICTVEGEQTPWALLDAVGERDLPKALQTLAFFLERETSANGSALRYVLQIGRRVVEWLRVRVFMATRTLRTPQSLQSFLQRTEKDELRSLAEEGYAFATGHPFRARMLAQHAMQYSGQELVDAVIRCRDANVQCVYSGTNPRLVVETLIGDIVRREP